MSSSSSEEQAKEITWTCQDGIKIAGKQWTNKTGHDENNKIKPLRIIALHGWMDNCATFDSLYHGLADKLSDIVDIDFVAIDFPGHGQSSHKSLDGPTSVLADYCYYVYDVVVRQLKWEPEDTTIIGHSMGASVALMFAAAFPVEKLVMLDSLGPIPKPEESISSCIKKHIKTRASGKMPSSIYPNFETAVVVRCKSPAILFPGKQYISEDTARSLVQRGSIIRDDGKLQFLHDQRLYCPSILFLSEKQIEVLYKDVSDQPTSTCLLLADDGMPFPSDLVSRTRNILLKTDDTYQSLPGSHHFHSDPDSVGGVVDTIVLWLRL